MTLRTWLSAALVVGLVSLSSASGLADSRTSAMRYEPAQRGASSRMEASRLEASRLEATRIAQSRSGRAVRADPPPPPPRAKQARLEPKPPADGARQAGSAANARTGRMRR